MLTFFDGEASSAPMTYYVNEKKNGISPKLAGQGAEFVSAQVNQTFAQTLAEVALDTASSMGDALSSTTATGAVTMLDNRVQSVATRLRTAADSADAYAALASSSLTLIDSTTTLVSGVGTAKSSAQSAVGSADSGATGLTAAATGAIASVSSAIDSSKTELNTLSTSVENVYSTASTSATDASASLRSQADVLDSHATTYENIKKTLKNLPGSPVSQSSLDTLQSAADRLRTLATNLRDAATDLDTKTTDAQTNHDNITALIADANQAVDDLSADYDNDLKPKLDSLASTLSSAQTSLSSARSSLSSSVSTASDGGDSVREKLTSLHDNLTSAASDMRDSAGKMDSLHTSIKEAQDSGNLTTLKDIIGNNPEALAAAIAAPVGVETIRVYPVANFGSQMAPMYTILALWVGSVLMAVSIRSDVSDDNVADGLAEDDPLRATLTASPIRLPAGYLGRYLIFGTIALAQATLLGLGDLYFLKVQHNHPLEFMGTLWLTAVVFSFLLYTLIATFGNAARPWVCSCWSYRSREPEERSRWQFCRPSSRLCPRSCRPPTRSRRFVRRSPDTRGTSMRTPCGSSLPSSCSPRSSGWLYAHYWCAAIGGWWPSWSPRSSCRTAVLVGTRPARVRGGPLSSCDGFSVLTAYVGRLYADVSDGLR